MHTKQEIIKTWDYLKEYEQEKMEIHNAIEKVMLSGRLILGESVKLFEKEFSEYCGVKYGVGVNSGTDALFLALMALDIGKNDEVITVANTAVPTISAIVSTGAIPKFVDIDPETYLIDTNKIEAVITKKTKCILPVHLYGQCANMEIINNIAKNHKLRVVEDCAQAHGAIFQGKKAGSMSDISAFSFYPTKILGGYGDGGMVLTNDKRLYKKLLRLRFYGMEQLYYSLEHGYNSRLDELHAEILRGKLKRIENYIYRRNYLANRYFELFNDSSLILPKITSDRHVFCIFTVRHKRRDEIIQECVKRHIFLDIDYPFPVHIMKGYKFLKYKDGDLPETEKASKEIFSLPIYPSFDDRQQEIVSFLLIDLLNLLELKGGF